MMQEAADRTVTWQSQWHVKTSTASMKHPPGVRGGGDEQRARQVKGGEGGGRTERAREREEQRRRRWRESDNARGHMSDGGSSANANANASQ